MALGPGKYDEMCTKVRQETKALGTIILVFSGDKGDGFSVQVPAELAAILPNLLRKVAREIEESFEDA